MRKHALLILFLAIGLTSFAQRLEYRKHDWDDSPSLDTLSALERREGGVIMLDKRIVETAFDEGAPVTYYTRHMIIRLNTDYAIEYYNKVYIPMNNVLELLEFRARFVSKDGKVHNMDDSNMKDVDNYNNNGPYKIYAMEGIEIGGQVEYIYTIKKVWRSNGTESYRSIYNYRRIELDIYSPQHLKYDAKTYNGLKEISAEDADDNDKRLWQLVDTNVEGYEDEMYSASNASYPRVEYKFAYNTSVSRSKRMNTWQDAAETFYGFVYSYSANEKRMAEMLYKKMGIDLMAGREERIRKIESYVKTNFTIRADAEGEKFETVGGVIQSKLGTELGLMRLYCALFEAADITVEVVITSDRFEKQFDGEFDSWTYLQYYLLYFPQTNNFLAPTSEFNRYGYVPGELAHQEGLFIKRVELGGIQSGAGSIKWIEGTKWDQNTSNLYVKMTFDLEKGMAYVQSKHTYLGHSASFIQPFIGYMSAQNRRESGEGIIRQGAYDARPKNLRISGYNGEDTLYRQPFVVEADFSTNSYLEKTCDKYIFKIGEVIGTQVSMYQKEKRRTDMVLNYPHGFYREIIFEVPEGYRVTNLDAINMNFSDGQETDMSMNFHSYYVQTGNTVKVIVEESYRETRYPVTVYDDFRRVINASADFNKVAVYFEKK